MGWLRVSLLSILFSVTSLALPVTRVIYDDDPLLQLPRPLLEDAYGATFFVIPANSEAPAKPTRVPGVVIHIDPDDVRWIRGDRNPVVEQEAIHQRILRDFALENIENKWDEYRFLENFPEIAMPEMHLGGEYTRLRIPEALKEDLGLLADRAMMLTGLRGDEIKHDLMRLEFIRRKIEETQGRSILKIRHLDHSEGKIPKTNKPWMEIYANFLKTTKPKMKELQRELSEDALPDAYLKLPYIEGRPLDALLENGNSVIVHSMIKIQKEVRVHIVDGKILPHSTFLRFYKVNEYLKDEDIQRIHEAVQTQFLDKLPRNLNRLNLTPDVVIENNTGRIRIIDLNMGVYSGYYYAEEDLFTTNFLVEHYTGVRPTFLKEWDAIASLPISEQKVEALKALLRKYWPLMAGDVDEAFWDRVQEHYFSWLRLSPSPENFELCLQQFRDAGLARATIFHQFLARAQSKGMRLTEASLERWHTMLNTMEADIRTLRRGDTLIAERRSKKLEPCSSLILKISDAA